MLCRPEVILQLTRLPADDIESLAKAAADKAAAEVREAHQAKIREADEQRRQAELRAAELKRHRLEQAKEKARREKAAEQERQRQAEEERQRQDEEERQRQAEEERERQAAEERQRQPEAERRPASQAHWNASSRPAEDQHAWFPTAARASAGPSGLSARAAGKLPEREEDGETEEEDLVRTLNPVGKMDSWIEVMEHAEKLGMPKWGQSLSLRLFELDRDAVQMEDRIMPQLHKMTSRVDRVRGRYDGIERQLEELSETLHDGLARINTRMDAYEQEMRLRMDKLENRFDKRLEALRCEWREALYRQNASVADHLEGYGERLHRWHDRFAELEVIVGAHVPDRDEYTIVPPAHPPQVIRIPPLPGDDEDLRTMEDHWIADEFRLGYSGPDYNLPGDDAADKLRARGDEEGSDAESGSASREQTPRLRPVSSYAPPPAPRAQYAGAYVTTTTVASDGPSSFPIRNATPGPCSRPSAAAPSAAALHTGAMLVDTPLAPPPGTVWPAQTLIRPAPPVTSQLPPDPPLPAAAAPVNDERPAPPPAVAIIPPTPTASQEQAGDAAEPHVTLAATQDVDMRDMPLDPLLSNEASARTEDAEPEQGMQVDSNATIPPAHPVAAPTTTGMSTTSAPGTAAPAGLLPDNPVTAAPAVNLPAAPVESSVPDAVKVAGHLQVGGTGGRPRGKSTSRRTPSPGSPRRTRSATATS